MKRLGQSVLAMMFLILIGMLVRVPSSSAQSVIASATWAGLFFPNTALSGSGVAATYTGLNQNWGTGVPTGTGGIPLAGIPADNFSARLTTTTTIAAGTYEFILTADDGVRLFIVGGGGTTDLVIDDFRQTGSAVQRSGIRTLAGGSYQLVIEYVEFTGNAQIELAVIPSTGTPQPTGTALPAAVVSPVSVRGLAVRSGPFLGGSLIGVARPDNSYPVIARNNQEGLFEWYKIQFDEDTIGWSSGRYLDFTAGAPENVGEENTTIFNEVTDPPGTVIGVTRSVMNFRQLPSERVQRVPEVPQLAWGAEVEIIARTVQGGRDFWYQVLYSPDNSDAVYMGWIFAPYVGIAAGSAPIQTVPIR